jgi:hypothetical protein
MNTSQKLLLAGVAAAGLASVASSAFAQASATTSATASVTIFQPITITKTADLAFGRVIRPSTGNTTVYTVSEANGATSTTGGDGIFTAGGDTPGRAAFTVNGEGGQAFNISLGSSSVTNGGVTINLVRSATTGTLDGTLGSAGTATFGVGGNVTLSDTSPTGTKSATFNVTVTYQ